MIILGYILFSVLSALAVYSIRNKKSSYYFVSAFVAAQWAFTVYEYFHLNESQFEYFLPDAIGIILLAVLSVLSVTSFIYSFIYLEKRGDDNRIKSIYLAAFIMLIMSLSCAYIANHVAIAWIFVELTTLFSSILIYHRRTERSLEGSWKYIFICSVSVSFIFIGILFLGLAGEEAEIGELFYTNLSANAEILNSFWLKAAFLFLFTGYTAKSGLVPMYTAGIDAKDKAPSPASAIFSSALMNVGFVGIFRVYGIITKTSIAEWASSILIISGILSILIASSYMIRVKNIKRMFAYSSIEHMGIIMLGMAMGGTGYFGAVLHIILHSFTKASLFYQYGSVFRTLKSKYINETGNYFEYNNSGAYVLLLSFFVVTAIPPSGMFMSEFLIFRSLFDNGYLWLLIPVVFLITIIIWAFGDNMFKLLFHKMENTVTNAPAAKTSFWESVPQFVLIFAVIYLGFNTPQFLIGLINKAIESLV